MRGESCLIWLGQGGLVGFGGVLFLFFFNDSLQLLAILELSSLKTKFAIIHCSLVAA